jgi:hypothetical protein
MSNEKMYIYRAFEESCFGAKAGKKIIQLLEKCPSNYTFFDSLWRYHLFKI